MNDFPPRIRNIYYRGRLDACNYHCDYCPFATRKLDKNKLAQDRQAFERFYQRVQRSPARVRIMLIPYGEALVHSFYREGMIRLAKLPNVEGVSCQTNLSFAAGKFLAEIRRAPADVSKIKLWASFHPEMVALQNFLAAAHTLHAGGVELCAGAVAIPAHQPQLASLRQQLNPRIYMFLNAPHGQRPLSPAERERFRTIDPLFDCECERTPADSLRCAGGKDTLFVDAAGRCHACPRSGIPLEPDASGEGLTPCQRKTCDCYIAYSHLHPRIKAVMGEGALWRIPPKRAVEAFFFDIDGTLTDAAGDVPAAYAASLAILARQVPLFLATALPVEYARMRLGDLFGLFSGGVFAAGAHIRCAQTDTFVACKRLPDSLPVACRVTAYTNARGDIFKYALTAASADDARLLGQHLAQSGNYTLFLEETLVTLVDHAVDKGSGVLQLCRSQGMNPSRIVAIGDSEHDLPMLSLTPYACTPPHAPAAVKAAAFLILTPDRLPALFGK